MRPRCQHHRLRHQRRRTAGWRKFTGGVCVTRPGRWGNPFPDAETFDRWFAGDPNLIAKHPELETRRQWMLDNLDSLAGKILYCFCGIDKPCHGNVLAHRANQVPSYCHH